MSFWVLCHIQIYVPLFPVEVFNFISEPFRLFVFDLVEG